MFTVGSADVVLAERGGKGAGTAMLADAGPAGRGMNVFVPRLPALPAAASLGGPWLGGGHVWHSLLVDGTTAAKPLALTRDALTAVVRVAGRVFDEPRDRRLEWNEQAIVQHLLAHALRRVAPQCADPAEAVRVAQALNDDHELFLVYGLSDLKSPAGQACASFDARAFKRHLAGLQTGQHGYVRVTLVHGNASHALAIAVRKQGRGQVRLAAINPAGWPQVPRPQGRARVAPAVFRTMDVDAAATAMKSLLAGPPPPIPAPDDAHGWVCSGQPLHAWLAGLDAAPGGNLRVDFHGTGRPLLTAPQKADDCAVDRIFGFMATALQPADCKLAKAAGLNLLLQLADRLEPPGTAAPGSALEKARCHLEWRITSSLSGSVVAREPSPAG